MKLLNFISSKIALVAFTFLGITLVSFVLIRLLPGDPILVMSGEKGISEERYEQLRAEHGLDEPIISQYFIYLGNVLQGNLGKSIVTQVDVLDEFMQLFPATVELALFAILIAIFIGIPVGILAAIKKGSIFDHGVMAISLTGYSMPIFWWALLMIILFSNTLDLLPVSGRISLIYYFEPITGFMLIDSWLSGQEGAWQSALSHLILPSFVLSTIPTSIISRQTRSAMIEVMQEDFIKTAKAKGLRPSRLIIVHALRNAMLTIITVIGLSVSLLLTGAILTETIFSWPGIGKWMVEGIFRRDYPIVQGGLILISLTVMLVNLTVDLSYGIIDPRVMLGKKT